MDYLSETKRKVNPRETANTLSILTFFYTLPLFKKGFKKDLEEKDLYKVVSGFESKCLGDRLEREWERQKKYEKNYSITRLLWRCYGWKYLSIGMLQLTVKTAIILLQPRALAKVVAYFKLGQTEISKADAYYYATVLVGLNLIHCVYVHNYHFLISCLGVQVRTAFCSFIFRKALRLSPEKLGDISIGKIVTLFSKDVHSFESFIHFANDMWVGFVKTALICYIIYDKIGLAALAGVGFFFIVMPLQVWLGGLAAKLRFKMCRKSDERLQITQETLSAVRIIKIYTWEVFFIDKIKDARKKEILSMHKIFILKFIVLVIGTLNAKIAFYLLIVTFIYLGNHITAEIVYFIQSCFSILTHTLSILFPLGVSQTAELFASIKRIGNVLKAMEIQKIPQSTDMTLKPKIIMKNVQVKFRNNHILKSINLDIDFGLTLIAGPVGSGKSFLLKTILQDYAIESGELITHGRISYASQEPWLFPSSIRQNILFGEDYNEKRYQQVLYVCALSYDFELFAAGDQTIVEDRGINLSKGQQARINLARAVYKEADIYLLDDCLSALDAHVSAFIFKECIQKFLRNKLVVLVTHNTLHIEEVDNVILMHHGEIVSKGNPSDLSEDDMLLAKEKKEIEAKTDDLDEKDEDSEAEEDTKLITETTTEKKVYHEGKQEGDVNWMVYKKYLSFGGGLFALFVITSLFGASQFCVTFTDILIATWVNTEEIISNYTIYNATDTPEYLTTVESSSYMLNLFSIMMVLSTLFLFLRMVILFAFAKRASLRLHRYMVDNIVNASMYFFDTNFIGNILNRFSKDLTTIDEHLPFVFYHVFRVLFIIVGIIISMSRVNATFLIPTAITFLLFSLLRWAYMPTGRSIKRLDATTRSPVVGHLNASLEGLTTIRAFKAQQILADEFDRHQDLYTSATYTMHASMRAFAYYLDTLCAFLILIIVFNFLIVSDGTMAGNVGLAITQAFMMTGTLQWGVRQWAEIENQMTSVERVLEYTEVPQEPKHGSKVENWPTNGEIIYDHVSLTYTNSSERVLKDLNFTVKPKEKIGIVGRTGAGKSSIISSLFRLYEVEGKIIIDDVDIKTLSLDCLRSRISIIPQDPVLFTGTIRNNIDPTNHYTDAEIWHAIEVANLKKYVPSLDFEITENGSNFSIGQRQLICLARAVIRNNKIIVLDEATANMDRDTDNLIHETIQRNLSDCTIIIIAHKLHSILNCDKVMVLDKGEIVEFDDPQYLLKTKNGLFYEMVKKARLLPEQQ